MNKACAKEKYCGSDLIYEPCSQCEQDLMLKLSKFNEVIERCFCEKAPNKLCEYIYDLSNAFNKFYHSDRIISEENTEKKGSWLCLNSLTKKVLEISVDSSESRCPTGCNSEIMSFGFASGADSFDSKQIRF